MLRHGHVAGSVRSMALPGLGSAFRCYAEIGARLRGRDAARFDREPADERPTMRQVEADIKVCPLAKEARILRGRPVWKHDFTSDASRIRKHGAGRGLKWACPRR